MNKPSYQPPQIYLTRYADILINVALGRGKGIKKGDVVYISIPEIARPLAIELYRAVLDAGGYPIMNYTLSADSTFKPSRELFERGTSSVKNYVPNTMLLGMVDDIDHLLRIDAPTDMRELQGIDQKAILKRQQSHQVLREAYMNKELEGNLTWTIADYGTEAMAKEAGISLKEYWKQIISACFLDEKEPLKKWNEVFKEIQKTLSWINRLDIQSVHMVGPDCDLTITIGSDRKWLGGRGANIPSFEVFTSPDWRGTEGWIRFNQPVYAQGVNIEGIELEFKKGIITNFSAQKNEATLKEIIKQKNANKLGEFSLTDKRLSRITRFMASTLYDENRGGKYGNSHIAVGMGYKDTFQGIRPSSKEEWEKVGMNDSIIHMDIVTTSPRTVTAQCGNGKEVVIYNDGMFTFSSGS